MNYSIIGAGAVGTALAQAFARKGMEVAIASRRAPAELAATAGSAGASVIPTTIEAALAAEIIILAVPFRAHYDIAKARDNWDGKIIIDATNAFKIPPEEIGGLPSSVVISRSFAGARLVKAFNHLPARVLAENPAVHGGRRVLFLSSNNEEAVGTISALIDRLGFAPVGLGELNQGGLLIQARGNSWAPLVFEELVKF